MEKKFGPIHFIPGENRGKYPFCNSIYIEGAGILIDPASDRARLEALRDGPGVKEVWLTHWHEDHFMHLDLFEERPLVLPALETEPFTNIETFMDWYGLQDEELRGHWRKLLDEVFHYRVRKPGRTFAGGERMELGTVTAEVLHTPGHTPGHLAFSFPEAGVLFLGDYDLTPFGPWYGDRDSSIDETIASVRRLQEVPARIWLGGHEKGLFESQPGDAWDRYLEVIDRREGKLTAYLNRPRTMEEIIEQWIVYRRPREPRPYYEFGERAIMGKHLERLISKGKVQQDGLRYALAD